MIAFSSVWQNWPKLYSNRPLQIASCFFPHRCIAGKGIDSFELNLLSGTVSHIQTCLKWSHIRRFIEEMFLKTPINAGKQVASTIFILFWQTLSLKWNSHLNWDSRYLLWEQRKLLRSTWSIVKRKTCMKILNYFNLLWHI